MISDLYKVCAYIFNSRRICAQVLCSFFLTCIGFCAYMFNSQRICAQVQTCIGSVPAYSIPKGYMHKFCVLNCLTIFG